MLEGKSLIVTGAGRGIGYSAAHVFAGYGAKLVVADIDEEAAKKAAAEIRDKGGEALGIGVDVTDETDVATMVETAVRNFGRLDGAFNNAGLGMNNKSLMDLSVDEWTSVFSVNVTGVFLCVKHQMRSMRDAGTGGSIVNAASGVALKGQANAGEYVASKHAVLGITRTAAIEGGPLGIRVNALCPGLVVTPLVKQLMDDPVFAPTVDDLLKMHRLGRFGKPEEIGEAAAWLISDRSGFITGAPISIDGGALA